MATLTITLPDEELASWERAAEQEGMGTEDYVRSVVTESRIFLTKTALEAELLRRLDSPTIEATDEFWEELEQEIIAERPRKNGYDPKG